MGGEGKDDEGSSEMDQPHWHLKIHFIKAKRTIEELRLNGTLSFFARVVAGGRGGRLNKELRLIGCETIRGALHYLYINILVRSKPGQTKAKQGKARQG